MLLTKIKFIQNIGRFENCKTVADASFDRCTLVFGENGWGKSTLADLLRSLTTNNPDILIGRKTLAGGSEQKAILHFGSQQATFENNTWSGFKPTIAVYDSVFVNENVFSGDVVSHQHLKKQYGLVIGEEGIRRVRRLEELDEQNRENNNNIRIIGAELNGIISAVGADNMTQAEFLSLVVSDDIDARIKEKDIEVKQASRAKELKAAVEPQVLPVPTETEEISRCLHSKIEQVAKETVQAVREHIAKHEWMEGASAMTHESWLETGAAFIVGEECAFCGQYLKDRTLIDSYSQFFSDAYKRLAKNVKAKRDIYAQYTNGNFRAQINKIIEQNSAVYTYWKEAGNIESPKLDGISDAISNMEKASSLLDKVFQRKQGNLTEAVAGEDVETAIQAWDKDQKEIVRLNSIIDAYVSEIKKLKDSIDATALPQLERELNMLQATKRRHHSDTIAVVEKLDTYRKIKDDISKEKGSVKNKLNEHGRTVTKSLGRTINSYLGRLNAGFRIDYKEPKYQGGEPSASYEILIKDVPVTPRQTSDSISVPSFRNTLSAGDKSTLALALFLAKINDNQNLKETIIVLDDPFTSLDDFRRQFTAIEIRKLTATARQVIVLSHDKSFLRLLWEKIDRGQIQSIAIQTGAPGITTIASFDIEAETQPRHVTERMVIKEFVEGEQHEPKYIKTRLRTVCENFYRRGDPNLFREAASLEEIVRILQDVSNEHPYKGVVDDLRDINEYSRGLHHAQVENDPTGESSEEELKGFCRRVLEVTCGM